MTRALAGTTPFEAWHGEKPSADSMRVFGAKAFIRLDRSHRQKLDAVAVAQIFLGFTDGVWGYRLFDPATRRLVTSRNVAFMEEQRMELELPTVPEASGKRVVLLSFPLPAVRAEGVLPERPEAAEAAPTDVLEAAEAVERRQEPCIEANLQAEMPVAADIAREAPELPIRAIPQVPVPPPQPRLLHLPARAAPVPDQLVAELQQRIGMPNSGLRPATHALLRRSTRNRKPLQPFWETGVGASAENVEDAEPEANHVSAVIPLASAVVLSPDIKPLPLLPPPKTLKEAEQRDDWPEWLHVGVFIQAGC